MNLDVFSATSVISSARALTLCTGELVHHPVTPAESSALERQTS